MVIYRFGPDKYSYTCGYLSVWLNRPLFRERWEALPVEVRESTERGYREALEKIAAFTLDGELDREMGSEDAYVIANEAIKIARAAIEAEDRKSASD